MMNAEKTFAANRQLRGLMMGLALIGLTWELATWIVHGNDKTLLMFGLGVVVCVLAVGILQDWRSGVYFFLVWLLFEDLARKFLGNSMVVYFGKDLLVGVCYVAFYFSRRRGKVPRFKIPFAVPFALFLWLAVIQVFNTWSPSFLYGGLGLKVYFWYVPLIFLGYALLETPQDLNRFLVINLIAGMVVTLLGIIQSIVGLTFLSPAVLAPEIADLGRLTRESPVTHLAVPVPTGPFVSGGRFSTYLILLWILAMGAQGYLLIRRGRGAVYGFLCIGVVTIGVMISGTRTPFVFVIASALVMTAAFLWGAPWHWGQGHQLVKALRRAFLVGGVGLILMAEVFPQSIGVNWALFSETLSWRGPGSEVVSRGWNYPVDNLIKAFEHERWVYGYGTGTSSLGVQYVAELLHQPQPSIGVESGFGVLIVEMGILGLMFWIVWVTAFLISGWRVVKQLRETAYFPLAFAILWYAFILLVPLTYFGMQPYQNFVMNAYLWLLLGILYRLPALAKMPQPVPAPKHARAMARWSYATGGR